MAQQHPDYLYRVYSDQSNGINTPKSFAPAALSAVLSVEHVERQPKNIPNFGEQLRKAIANNQGLTQCNTCFFTTSFLFALVLAGLKAAKKESNITIVCFRVDAATTPIEQPVKFHSVDQLIDDFNIKRGVRKSDGSDYSYAHEYAVTTPVILGDGSCYVRYLGLFEKGLYKLYPELEIPQDDGRVIFNFAMDYLRIYWFGQEDWCLSREKMTLLGRLASSFVPCTTGGTAYRYGQTLRHIAASFAGVQKRSPHDKALNDWIVRHSPGSAVGPIEIDDDDDDAAVSKVPECTQAQHLSTMFSGVNLPIIESLAAVAVDEDRVQAEKEAWAIWKSQARAAYRASRPDRPARVEKKRRQPRTAARQPRGDSERGERPPRTKRTPRQPRTDTRSQGAGKQRKTTRRPIR